MDRWHGPADTILSTHRASTPSRFERGFYRPQQHLSQPVGELCWAIWSSTPLWLLSRRTHANRTATKLNPEVYVACGAAAAISAGFGAPIAGVIFACEAILRHFSVRALAPIIVSSIIASAILVSSSTEAVPMSSM